MENETIDKVAFKSPNDMIQWQLREIIAELQELQRHAADPTCPCVQHDNGENCLMKHALGLRTLAAETAIMYPEQRELLTELADEALTQHLALKDRVVCDVDRKDEKDTEEWARNWRKRIEPIYYACQVKGEKPMELHRIVVEKAATICETTEGRLVMGSQAVGTEDKVHLDPLCPVGSTMTGVWHRHPGEFKPIPSEADIKEIPPGGTSCITGVPATMEKALPRCSAKEAKKLERCILAVKSTNGDVNPFAVCKASVGCKK